MITRMIITAVLLTSASFGDIAPDIIVAADGSGQFKSVHEAVQSIPRDNAERIVILIKDGVYNEKVRIDAACVTLRGESRSGTRIEFAQLNDDFVKTPDALGRAVINIEGKADDLILENLTIANTAGVVGPHSFAIYGKADRTVIIDCDVLSEGADTVSLWKGDTGRYYHARCNFRGAVDFVCPRGWCYVTDCAFYETKATAAIWHDGSRDREQKFVIRNSKLDGVEGWVLARHHRDAAIYFIDCQFSASMADRKPQRVIYPIGGGTPTTQDIEKNAQLDKENQWGERIYFYNCRREGGNFEWMADNLDTSIRSPKPEDITALWTFMGTWDPESTEGPTIVGVESKFGSITLKFSEPVTVKGKPKVLFERGVTGTYESGSGSDTLVFKTDGAHQGKPVRMDPAGGAIFASMASVRTRHADLPTQAP